MMSRQFQRKKLCVALVMAGMSSMSLAMVTIEDEDLSSIAAQSGLTISVKAPAAGVSATSINTTFDASNATYAAKLSMEGVTLKGVDTSGNLTAAPFSLVTNLDAGSTAAGIPYASLDLKLDRSRLRVDALRHGGEPTRSYGVMAIDGDAAIKVTNRGGLFYAGATDSYLFGELGTPVSGTDGTGRLFYRQLSAASSPFLVLNNLHAMWEIPQGTFGVSSSGILMQTAAGLTNASLINLALDYDILYKNPAVYSETGDFQISQKERPLMHFGWLGSVKNAYLLWQPIGSWNGTQVASGALQPDGSAVGNIFDYTNAVNQTAGIRLTSRWNFVSRTDAATLGDANKEFRWQLGEAAGTTSDKSRINFELGDWVAWRNNTYSHDFPLIALDVLTNTSAGGGPGGLCWGYAYNGNTASSCSTGSGYTRQFVNLQPRFVSDFDPSGVRDPTAATPNGASPIALLVRKGNLQSYSRSIRLLERDAAGAVTSRDFKWGLIYTLSNIDANIYLYPGGNPGGTSNGMIADIMLMMQTFGATDNASTTTVNETYTQGANWDKGFHFMIADTDAGVVATSGSSNGKKVGMGIGLIDSNLLLLADDTRIQVKPTASVDDFYSGGIDLLSNRTRINLRTTFGGGELADPDPANSKYARVVRGALINLNIEGMVNLRFSPSHSGAGGALGSCTYCVGASNFLGYSGAIRFMNTNIANFSESTGTVDDGSFLSLAEPNRSDIDIRLANVTGDLALTNGRIDLRGTGEDGDSKPKLVIAHTMLLGSVASSRMTTTELGGITPPAQPSGIDANVFRIGALKLGQNTLGQIVIPSAQIYQSITLKPQCLAGVPSC